MHCLHATKSYIPKIKAPHKNAQLWMLFWHGSLKYEYQCEEIWFCCMWTTKLQASLSISEVWSGPEAIKLFSFSTQLSTKFVLLINVKMPKIVGILTFISRRNTINEYLRHLKQETSSFVGILVFMISWVEHEKSFITSGPVPMLFPFWRV